MLILAMTIADTAVSQTRPTVFRDVRIRVNRNETDTRLVDKDAVLVLDSSARKLAVTSPEKSLTIPYEHIRRVQFEVTTHMRGGALSQFVGIAGSTVGAPEAGMVISNKLVNDYWCYIEYEDDGSKIRNQLLEIGKDSSESVIQAMTQTFGERVTRATFSETAESVNKKNILDLQSKHSTTIDKKVRPLPKADSTKALIVVVCPALAARDVGKGNQFKIHANDRVVIVNRPGTYAFAYLDPGDYMLVSQAENASGFHMRLEAGQEYYFLQNSLGGTLKKRTTLSRNSKELVMYELSGAYYSNWKRTK